MPALIWGALQAVLGSYIGKILLYLGISYYTYQGVDLLLNALQSKVFSTMGQGLGGNYGFNLGGLLGLLKVGESINVLFSAIAARFTLMGLTNGSITRMLIK